MSEAESSLFRNRKPEFSLLAAHGFVRSGKCFRRTSAIADDLFRLEIVIDEAGLVHTRMTDCASEEDYTLHRMPGAVGSFVGRIREEYLQELQFIAANCFVPDVFKGRQSKLIMAHAESAYGSRPEFLWDRLPEAAVLRRAQTQKWYGVLMKLSCRKLGLDCDEIAEVLNLHATPDAIEALVDRVRFFPGYHMHKRHWFTVCLNDSISDEELLQLMAESYRLAVK